MGMAAASACKARRRWFRLTPDGGVVLMLALEGFLLLSAWFRWFPFNQHKGWTVLICIASVGAALLLMFLWFLAALVFRWRFQFSILALLLLVVVVAIPCSWLATEMKAARQQKAARQGLQKAGVLAWYDGELDGPSAITIGYVVLVLTFRLGPAIRNGHGHYWETISSRLSIASFSMGAAA